MSITCKELAGQSRYVTRDLGSGCYWVWERGVIPRMDVGGAWYNESGTVAESNFLADPRNAPNLPAEGRALLVTFPPAKPEPEPPEPREWDVVEFILEIGARRLIVRGKDGFEARDMDTFEAKSFGDGVVADLYRRGHYRVLGNLRDGYDSRAGGGSGS
jgi:hypothetical protein